MLTKILHRTIFTSNAKPIYFLYSTSSPQLDKKLQTILIPFNNFGGKGDTLYFLHANGFPPKAYNPLLTHLTNNFIVEAPLMRPLWKVPPSEPIKTWKILGDDFIKFTEQRNINPIIGVGHSIGGTLILYSAIQRPNLFSKIFLLDPVLQPLSYHYGWRIAKKIGLASKVNPMIGSKLRRKNFGSKDEIFKRYRKKNVFSKLSDEALNIYIENSTREMAHS